MAAVEVLAFAASETYGWPPNPLSTNIGHSLEGRHDRIRERGINDCAACLNHRLGLIAQAWVDLRSVSHPTHRKAHRPRPLVVPDIRSPKWSRARRLPSPPPREPKSANLDSPDPATTDAVAQRRRPDCRGCERPTTTESGKDRRQRSDDRDRGLLAGPAMDLIDLDFGSDEGFLQAAGKKKKKQTTTFNWADDDDDKKDGDGADGGGDGNKDQNGGDSGARDGSANGDDGKKDDDKDAGEANNDDIWDFAPVSKKKNKNKNAETKITDTFGLPDIPSTDFHEIKLDDAGGGEDSVDPGPGAKPEKIATGLTAWTSSWTTGSWGWGGLKSPGGSEMPKPVEEEQTKSPEPVDDNPWSINRGKPKKKTTTFSFGSFDEADNAKDESIDFLGSNSNTTEKKDPVGFSWGAPAAKTGEVDFCGNLGKNESMDDKSKDEDKPIVSQEVSDDIWGFSSTKKDKKKKNKIAVIDETPAPEDPSLDPVFEFENGPEDTDKNGVEDALVAEEEAELRKLQTKKDIGTKLTKKQQDRYKTLTENAKARADAAAAESKAEDSPAADNGEAASADDQVGGDGDPDLAQFEADEKARIVQEEEDEMFLLKSKKKLKKADKDRLRVLEDNAEQREREAQAAVAAKEQDEAVPEVIDAAAEAIPAQAVDSVHDEAGEKARVIKEEEEELAQLRAKKKPKKADKDRIRVLEDRADDRAREAEEAADALDQSIHGSNGDTADSKTDETIPTSVDDPLGEWNAGQADKDEAARLVEEEEMEMEILLSKSKLKKADKARLKELQDNKERRQKEATAEVEVEASPPSDEVVPLDDSGAADAPKTEDDDLAAKIIEEEEMELELLLSKSKLKKAEKARLKVLQDSKDQREQVAAVATDFPADPPVADAPLDDAPPAEDNPVDKALLQRQTEDALIAAEESELSDLLGKSKLKKTDKARLKELQDRKDKRDEEARLAREKAEQDARELEEQQKREEEEKRDAEIAAEEEEISSLKSKKKLKRSEKDRLAELESRRDERTSAEAAKMADEFLDGDAQNAASKRDELEPLSWADDDPAANNAAGDDWLDWGLSGSKKSKKKGKEEPIPDPPAAEPEPDEDDVLGAWGTSTKKDKKKKGKSSNLIDLGGGDDPPAFPDVPTTAREVDGFDFGWGKQTSKTAEPGVDDLWNFGGSSKKKKAKDAPAEVVEDTDLVSPIDEVKDKGTGTDDDFWSTFGVAKKAKDKKSSKDDQAADPPPPVLTSPALDLTETEEAGNVWSDPSGSIELAKSKSSDKESTKNSSSPKDSKLSKKELEKIEKEKKKAEKEQKVREEQEAKELAEKLKIEEEERLAAEAKAGEERLAQEEADRIRKEEDEKQAALDAIAQEESELAALQAKKDAGKKLTKKDKDKFDKLSATCQARADERAAQEAAEQAAREEAERLQREAEEQARKEAIEKEEDELKQLQKKKDAGRKLLKKDKERYEVLSANKKARKQAEKEPGAPKAEPDPADEANPADPFEQDLAKLNANELDELDKFLSAPGEPAATKKAAEVDPFSFWGASKKSTPSSKKGKSSAAEPSASAEIAHAESSSSHKLLEATAGVSGSNATEMKSDGGGAVATWPVWKDTFSSSTPSAPAVETSRDAHRDKIETSVPTASPPAPTTEPMKRKSIRGAKIADRLTAFQAPKEDELVPPPPPPAPVDPIPPPPPPPPPVPVEQVKSKRKSKKITDIPGSFPTEDEENPDDIIEVITMPSPKGKKASSKKSSKIKSDDAPIPIPPPPPAVPDAPISDLPAPEAKKSSKKERPKINRDGGSSWGTWTASAPREKERDKKSSLKSKAALVVEEPKERKSRSPEKEEKLSTKGSTSDKAERAEKKDKDKEARPKLMSVFASTPPISRSMPTREKRHKEGKSSRRPSFDVDSGLISPPPEEVPEVNSKAAKILGIGEGFGLGRSNSKRKKSSRPVEDDDIVIVGPNNAESSPEKSSRRRPSRSYPRDDDIVMVDAADATATPPPGLRRSNTTGSAKKSFGGLFGGILNGPRTEARKRKDYHTDGEDGTAAMDADIEARKAARRARRVEREVAERSREDARREKRRKEEEEAEAQRQAEKEARRAERRAARVREEEDRDKDAAREERRRQKRADRDKEREALETGAEEAAAADARRAARRERRKVRAGESDRENDEERRRRRAEKRATREAEGKPPGPSRRRTEPVEDDFVYPRPEKISRRHTDGLGKTSSRKAAEGPVWPYSGTSSWVKDHSDAGPPPEDTGMTTEAVDDDMNAGADEDAARRERRRRRRYGDVDVDVSGERQRRSRREDRSEGSDERRRAERKASLFTDGPGARNGGGIGGFWKKLTGN